MSRYKPTAPQLAALRSIAAGRVIRSSVGGPYIDSRTGTRYPLSTVRRLLREGLVDAPEYGHLFTVTDDGRALLAALDGAS